MMYTPSTCEPENFALRKAAATGIDSAAAFRVLTRTEYSSSLEENVAFEVEVAVSYWETLMPFG
jgi:hypothetical protein